MPLTSPETDTETRVAIAEQNDRETAEKIMAAYRAADRFAVLARANVKSAVEEAVKCGAMLIAKKENCDRWFWTTWMSVFLPQIKMATARRLMELSRRSQWHDGLENAKTLREAYIAVGMLPDPVELQRKRNEQASTGGRLANSGSGYLALIHKLYSEKAIEALLTLNDFSSWDSLELELLERELAPLVTVHERIKTALAPAGVSDDDQARPCGSPRA